MKYWAGNNITINPNYTLITPVYVFDNDKGYNYDRIKNLANNTFKKYTGEISKSSMVKLRFAISLLNYLSKPKKVLNNLTNTYYTFKISFITLTLPSPQNNISDNEIKNKYLNNFLIQSKNKYGMKDYIWKAETQENGNIHFHITTNIYYDHQKLRNLWNKILSNGPFINEFYEKNRHYNPNSTDIHSVKNIVNYENYMVKYMCKKEENRRKIVGKIWDCSNSLNYKNRLLLEDYDSNYEIEKILEEKLSQYKKEKEYCSIYEVRIEELKRLGIRKIDDIIKDWENKIKVS